MPKKINLRRKATCSNSFQEALRDLRRDTIKAEGKLPRCLVRPKQNKEE